MAPDLIQSDVTGGREPLPIPLVGLSIEEIADLTEPFHTYVTDSIYPDSTSLDIHRVASAVKHDDDVDDEEGDASWGCECAEGESTCGVKDGDTCECVANYGNFYTTSTDHSQVLRLDALPSKLPLVECGSACQCSSACSNRLTQRGVHVPMTVSPTLTGIGIFYTPSHPATLPTGSFISLYAGEYLTTEQARSRWADSLSNSKPGQGNYILSLRLPNELVHIDPRHIGNVGRFLNHSCDPNCIIEVVKWGAHAPARAAIFTRRDIHDGEELTFDYGNASGQPDDRGVETGLEAGVGRTRCLCGSAVCKGYMPYDETL